MTDIVERLLAPAPHPVIGCECELCELSRLRNDAAREIERLRTERNLWKERTEQGSLIIEGNVAEIERLTTENWQLRQACGYSIPADKETPQNPFKCGTCDAKSIEVQEMRAEIERLHGIEQFVAEAARHERDGLRADNERLLEQVATLQASSGYEVSIAQVEIERLRQDNAEMRELINTLAEGRALEHKPWSSAIQIALETLNREKGELRADNERLTALHEAAAARAELAQIEVERLRAAHQEIRELVNNKIVSDAGLFMRALLIARRALEPKPTYTAANGEELPKGSAGTTIVNDGRPT